MARTWILEDKGNTCHKLTINDRRVSIKFRIGASQRQKDRVTEIAGFVATQVPLGTKTLRGTVRFDDSPDSGCLGQVAMCFDNGRLFCSVEKFEKGWGCSWGDG